jgi:class 3 adenylate cyclase
MECPSCKADIPEGSHFCIECGAALPVLCPTCGHGNPARAKFCAKCGTRLAASGATTPTAALSAATSSQTVPNVSSAERRQLTVLFCDLVGSTALASRLDPEDLREIIAAYHRRVAKVVARYGGFVAKYMGDGALAYFGYPQAHEDDAERAVRTGLKLAATISRVGAGGVEVEPLQVRVGIATGLVIVGDLVGAGEAQERGIVGETPNLAARLQVLAEPNGVVIRASTRRLLGDLFEVRDLGAVEVKGFAAPVPAWQVLRESRIESRFEALHSAAALTPLVGREEEIELLLGRWQRARSGEGQVVLISGEPGIGKSRLIAALQDRIVDEPQHARLRYFCSPYHQNSALHPVIAQLERAAGFERGDAPKTKLGKLEALLAPICSPREDVALFAALLSIPTVDERYPPLDLLPERRKRRRSTLCCGNSSSWRGRGRCF